MSKKLLCFLVPALFPVLVFSQPSPEMITANAYVLYDHTSGQFLAGQEAERHIPPAHLTKLMTAYVVFGAIRQGKLALTQRLIPSRHATRAQENEPRMFLRAGQEVTVETLLYGLIVQSANDAARVLAEHLAHHEMAFADIMNSEAERLELHDTHFANATGLPDAQHYSSARDLARLAAALIRDFPGFYTLYARREYEHNGIHQYNRNRLLWLDPYVDGVAAGRSDTDGFHLIASAQRDGRRLIAVVLGAVNEKLRNSEAQRLLNHGFQDFETLRLYSAGQPVSTQPVWKGTQKQIHLGFTGDCYLTLPKGGRAALKATLETHHPILAPIRRGQPMGVLHLSLHGRPWRDLPVVALDEVPLANVFSRGVDSLRLMFQ